MDKTFYKSASHVARIFVVLLNLLALFALSACVQNEEVSPSYENLVRAKSYIKQGQLSAARIELLNALQADANNPETYFILSDMLASIGAFDEASQQYQKGLSLSKDNNKNKQLELFMLQAKAGSNDTLAKQIAEFIPDNEQQKAQKLIIEAMSSKDFSQAEQLYKSALEIDPALADANYGLAKIALANQNIELAKSYAQKMLQISAKNIDALLLNGHIALLEKRGADAEKLFNDALLNQQQFDTMTSRKYFTLSGLVEALNQQEKYEEALTYSGILAKSNPGKLKSSYENAITAFSEQDTVKAEEELQKALSIAPDHGPSNFMMGMSKLKAGDLDAAEKYLSTALDGKYIPEKTRLALILTRLKLNHTDQALTLIEAGLAENPENPVYHSLKGSLLFQQDKQADAESEFKKALSLDKTLLPAISGLAKLYEKQGNLPAAKEQLTLAVDSAPDSVPVLAQALQFGLQHNDPEWVLTKIKTLQASKKDLIAPSLVLAAFYFQKQDFLQAQKYLDSAEIINANDPLLKTMSSNLHFIKAVQAARSGNNKEALAQINHTLVLTPKNIRASILKAGILLKDGKRDDALAIAKNLKNDESTKIIGWELEGNIWAQLAQFDKALTAYNEIWRTNKNSGLALKMYQIKKETNENDVAMQHVVDWAKAEPKNLDALITLAMLQQENKNQQAAIDLYEQALALKNDNPLVLNNLAYIYFENSNPKALELAEKAYTLAPKSPAIADTYGWILVKNNQLEKGLPILKQAAEAAPKVKDILHHYSEALTMNGDVEEAAKVMTQITKL